MPRLFSYGSLRHANVQLTAFGRLLEGKEDELVGFELVSITRAGKQLANVTRNGLDDSRVAGMVFEVSEAELLAADEYERGDSYVRISARLASGIETWVYAYEESIDEKK